MHKNKEIKSSPRDWIFYDHFQNCSAKMLKATSMQKNGKVLFNPRTKKIG